jgi:DNA modification methylase
MLIRADARQIPLKASTVQCCVTSPPYWGLRNYGDPKQIGLEKTHLDYIENIRAVAREVWRVLRNDGTFWLNLGDSMASGKGTCHNPGGGTSSFNVHLKEQNVHPLDRGNKSTLARVGLKPKDLVGIPWRVAFALQADGWYLRSDIIWAKPNPMPESVTDRPTKDHEYIFLLTKSARYYFDSDAVKELSNGWNGSEFDDGKNLINHPNVGKNRHWRDSATKRREVNPGSKTDAGFTNGRHYSTRNVRSVWNIATQPYSGAHFATFPREIPERCIKAGSRPGDIILDPFCGSGTTIMVARDLGRMGIGLDLKYQDLAAERISGPLFAATINA